jgi:tRNA-splicing ligase RtcB
MAGKKLRINEIKKVGFQDGRVIQVIQDVMLRQLKDLNKKGKLHLLRRIYDHPEKFRDDPVLGIIATEVERSVSERCSPALKKQRSHYRIYGAEHIEQGAMEQMDTAMRLPIAVKGALMPDAHLGYGLPIGGVLATQDEVIPFGVGVDIGCRVCLSVFPIPTEELLSKTDQLRKIILENTRFGFAEFEKPIDHEVLSRPEFKDIHIVKSLKDKAFRQIGTSGGGNHFVEFGKVQIEKADSRIDLECGSYIGLLSHSGSRGFGASVASYYTQMAMEICRLPGESKHLAWLSLDSNEGQEYWKAMNLAGDYARANHQQIHQRIAHALGTEPLARVENHHNFAWMEEDEAGRPWVVHRKGATPAGRNALGVIPGSMTLPGFIIRGKGEPQSINSASHGAGRVMSRRKAKKTLSESDIRSQLHDHGVDLTGGGLDEAPQVYKNIHQIMSAQRELVEVLGTFTPKIVRMCGDRRYVEVD